MKYKVLTLWEPWASLLVYGEKKIETRPKQTNWTVEKNVYGESSRGIYLIHAAKQWTKEQEKICLSAPFKLTLEGIGMITYFGDDTPWHNHFNNGHIIGSIEVKMCLKIVKREGGHVDHGNGHYSMLNVKEVGFGNYDDGRWMWICENPKILKTPIPYKNGQGYYQDFKGDESKLIFI